LGPKHQFVRYDRRTPNFEVTAERKSGADVKRSTHRFGYKDHKDLSAHVLTKIENTALSLLSADTLEVISPALAYYISLDSLCSKSDWT
jgi:hypothetical protein